MGLESNEPGPPSLPPVFFVVQKPRRRIDAQEMRWEEEEEGRPAVSYAVWGCMREGGRKVSQSLLR